MKRILPVILGLILACPVALRADKVPTSMVKVENFSGSDFCAQMVNAIAALPASGGILDARSVSGTQACAGPFWKNINKSVTIYLIANIVESASDTIPPNVTLVMTPTASVEGTQGSLIAIGGQVFVEPASGITWPSAVQDQGGQVFNAKAYGAVCDGATDDTTAIQAAITAAAAVNGTALVPSSAAGCVVATFLTMPASVTLAGTGHSKIIFTGNGGGACTDAQNPVTTGFIRWSSGANRITGLAIDETQFSAGTCLLNLQDGGETSTVEIDHNAIGSNNTADTNIGIYSYSVDTISIHDNVFKYIGQPIFGGQHTWAKVTIGPNNVFWGQTTTKAMVQTPGAFNCFQVSIIKNVFEGFYSTNGIGSSCKNGQTIQDNYFGDPSATGGTWINGNGTLIDNYIVAPSNGQAISGGDFYAVGNYLYGTSLLTTGGTFIGNTFESGPAAGCFISMNQSAVVESIRNNFTTSGGAANSYCHTNNLTPHPIVRQINDTDSTTSGIQSGVTRILVARTPNAFSTLPACTADTEGISAPITDSTTNTRGAVITGGGTNHVDGLCNTDGTSYAWRVLDGIVPVSGGGAWTLISSQILSVDTATVTFSSIPATYHQLELVVVGRCSDAATQEDINVTINGDVGADYDLVFVGGQATSASAFSGSAATSLYIGTLTAATATAAEPGSIDVRFPAYANTTFNKNTMAQDAHFDTLGTTSTYLSRLSMGNWRSTAAINSISLVDTGGGNFIAGSAFYLYGIM